MSIQQITWQGERKRQVKVYRPCECGCDTRDGTTGAGYITGSDAAGNGFTIWINTEEVFAAVQSALNERL